jgi:ribonuclease E
MAKRMLIDALHPEETRVVIVDNNQIHDFDFVSTSKKQLKGNIYLAKITRVEPSLQAAFVEYGGGKQGFLPFSEIHADYYQIPVSDRQRLMEEAARDDDGDDDSASEADSASDMQPENFSEESEQSEDADEQVSSLPLAPAINIDEVMSAESDDDSRPIYEESTHESASESAPLPSVQDMPELVEGQEPLVQSGDALVAIDADGKPEERSSAEGESAGEDVETIANDEELSERPKRNNFFKRYKIQEVIRRGQIVLVQVIKEERGNKGVSLTTYLSLAGRYCVLMPNSPKDGGISRKIASADDRKRLKAISTELRLAQGMSVIIRTAGMDRTRAEIKRDFDYLVKLWNCIREDTLKSTAPALIYEESDIIKRAIRDQYSNDIEEIIVEGDIGYRTAKDFMKMLLPSHLARVKHYKEATPLFYAHNVEEQLLSMHDPVVKLRSGGYIVINPTEALISIDVNSGRATGERNIEETALKTNLETAVEVARQLRLRDLAGLIVIDFIDMMESRNRRAVEKALRDALKADRAKIQLGRISPFGLLEMSRQRLRPSISETNMVQCPHCAGRGYIRSNESMSIQIIRSVEKEASNGSWGGLRVVAPQGVALHLLNTKRDVLRSIEERYGITITVSISSDHAVADFTVEKLRRAQSDRDQGEARRGRRGGRDRAERDRNEPREVSIAPTYDELPAEESDSEEETSTEAAGSSEGGQRRSRSRRRRGGRRGGERGERGQQPEANAQNTEGAEAPAEGEAAQGASEDTNAEGGERRRRERGGRGRRRWRERGERGPREESAGGEPAQQSETFPQQAAAERPMPVEAPKPTYTPPAPQLVSDRQPQAMAVGSDSTPRDPSGQPKKGWWKKMIDLDS